MQERMRITNQPVFDVAVCHPRALELPQPPNQGILVGALVSTRTQVMECLVDPKSRAGGETTKVTGEIAPCHSPSQKPLCVPVPTASLGPAAQAAKSTAASARTSMQVERIARGMSRRVVGGAVTRPGHGARKPRAAAKAG